MISKKDLAQNADWMMEKFFQKYELDPRLRKTAKARISAAKNLVIETSRGNIVYDPQNGIVLLDTTGLINRANWIPEPLTLEGMVNTPEFLQSLAWSEYMTGIRILREPDGIWYCAEFKEGSPVDGEKHFLIKPTKKKRLIEEQAVKTIADTSLVSRLSQAESMKAAEGINQIFLERKRLVEPYLSHIKSARLRFEALDEKDRYLLDTFDRGAMCGSVHSYPQRLSPGKSKVTITISPLSFTYDFATGKADFTPSCKRRLDTLQNKIELFQKYEEQYRDFRTLAARELGELAKQTAFTMEFDAKAEPPVTFCATVAFSDTSIEEHISPKAMKTGVHKLVSHAKRAVKENEKAQLAKQAAIEKSAREMACYGNFLAISIYKLVNLNWKHITENVVVQILRGTSIQSNFSYEYGETRGLYSVIDKDTISNMIELLIKEQLITRHAVRGEYGRYYELKALKDDRVPTFLKCTAQNYGKNKKYTVYTDADWAEYLTHTDPASLKDNDWKKILPILEHANVYCKYRKEYVSFFAYAPDSMIEYIHTRQGIADKAEKRFLRELYQEITESREERNGWVTEETEA